MSIYSKLQRAWHQQQSLVCVGLDPDLDRIPAHIRSQPSPYFEFCRRIVDATAPHVCAYKPQFAHFGAAGAEAELQQVCEYIRSTYPDVLLILDAKRGDIGSTATYYAREAFDRYAADAVTVNPYLGYEGVAPYLEYEDRGIVVLCRTSNADSDWLQNDPSDAVPVFEKVARRVLEWNDRQQCMLVTGATYPAELGFIRQIVGDMPLLVPGIGAQGGDLNAVLAAGLDSNGTGLLISSSRAILYAAADDRFADAAGDAAASLKDQINSQIKISK